MFYENDLPMGTPVKTPLGEGTVKYIRLNHLSGLWEVASVSVLLPGRNLAGVLFPADKIEKK